MLIVNSLGFNKYQKIESHTLGKKGIIVNR